MNLKDNYDGALQKPSLSGFGARTNAAEIISGIDLSGKTAVVTGGYAGIGLETVRVLTAAGAGVFVPARDLKKATTNLKGIAGVQVEPMDLTDPESVTAFAKRFSETYRRLDLLVNNAGIMWVPLIRDRRGFESQLSTNHLGHFILTATLWPMLKRAGNARVVTVSSFGHQISPFDFDDPNFLHTPYETLQGYGRSKTANNLFTVELDHRAKESGVRAFSLHPGSVIGTDLARTAPMELFQQMGTHDREGNLFPEVAAKLKTVSQGAATTIWCAVHPQLEGLGGVYCEDADIAPLDTGNIEHNYSEPASLRGVKPYSVDGVNAARLWSLTEKWTGTEFPVR